MVMYKMASIFQLKENCWCLIAPILQMGSSFCISRKNIFFISLAQGYSTWVFLQKAKTPVIDLDLHEKVKSHFECCILIIS